MIEIQAVGEAQSDTHHPVRSLAGVIDRTLGANMVGWLEAENGFGVTPDLSEKVDKAIQEGIVPFSIRDRLERRGADGEGSEVVTALHVHLENEVSETVGELKASGQVRAANELFRHIRTESDPEPETLTAYTVLTYSKGWAAERIVANHSDFSKLWVSNDKSGQDLRYEPESVEIQLKCVTYYAGNSKEARNAETPHWFYQWTGDGLLVGPYDEANAVNREASNRAGVGATVLKKSYDGEEILRDGPGRILWW
jgi:hypothetical protein